jgi:hypothetical protein
MLRGNWHDYNAQGKLAWLQCSGEIGMTTMLRGNWHDYNAQGKLAWLQCSGEIGVNTMLWRNWLASANKCCQVVRIIQCRRDSARNSGVQVRNIAVYKVNMFISVRAIISNQIVMHHNRVMFIYLRVMLSNLSSCLAVYMLCSAIYIHICLAIYVQFQIIYETCLAASGSWLANYSMCHV